MYKRYCVIKGKKYAYLVESYREGGKVRQRFKQYLGRVVEKNGVEEIIPPKRAAAQLNVKKAYRYGDIKVLHEIAMELKIQEIVDNHAPRRGLTTGALLTIMAINRLLEPRSNAKLASWYGDTALVELLEIPEEALSSQNISNCFDNLCSENENGVITDKTFGIEKAINTHLQGLYGRDNSSVVYDLTSTYVYGSKLPLAAFGYNRDDKPLPQINIALAVTGTKGFPLHFRILPGNIVDVTTFKGFLTELKAMGIEKTTLVIDRGIYSEDNLKELVDAEHHVVGALPARLKIYREIMSHARDIEHSKYAVMRDEKPVFLKEVVLKVEEISFKAVVVLDPARRATERSSKLKRILEIENKLKELNEKIAKEEFRGNWKEKVKGLIDGFSKCFELRWHRDGFTFKRRTKAVERILNRVGKYIVFSTDLTLSGLTILNKYLEKDVIEKAFFVFKQDEELHPLRSRLENHVNVQVFTCVLGYLLYTVLRSKLTDHDLTVRNTLEELSRIKEVVFTSQEQEYRILTELTKKQKEIVKALKMEKQFELKNQRSG